MRKFLFVMMLMAAMTTSLHMTAQPQGVATYEITNPHIVMSGSFVQPSSYVPVNAAGTYVILPWYTKTDTVTNTGVDTFKQKITGYCNSVYTWVHVTGITGTNTACTVKLEASADSSTGADWIPIYTATVTATNPAGYSLINGGYGWPYTNLRWRFSGSGTQVSSWYGGLMIRYWEDDHWADRPRNPWDDIQ